MGKILRGGMIGAGAWSGRQLTAWQGVSGAQIVALCDRHPQQRKSIAETFGIEHQYDDFLSMLEEQNLDFVDICVRPRSQRNLVEISAKKGLNILCQKPFGLSLEDSLAMVSIARKHRVRLMINENFRWQPWYRKIKDLIDEGVIGTPFIARSHVRVRFTLPEFTDSQRYLAEMNPLLTFEMGPHYFDLARYLFGEPQTIYAKIRSVSPHIKGEDLLILVLGYEKLIVTMDTSWASVPIPGLDRECKDSTVFPHILEIDGTLGTLILRPDFTINIYTDSDTRTYSSDINTLASSRIAAQQHFIACLNSGDEFETNGNDYLKNMALVWGAYHSAQKGAQLNVKSLYKDVIRGKHDD